jgi:undecaprenyl-diphosphatase
MILTSKEINTVPKLLLNAYHLECQLFHQVNKYFDHKGLNLFFRTITHLGGATFTITMTILLILFTQNQPKYTAMASALALAFSHLPVQMVKKLFPRKRPYLTLEKTKFPVDALKDHSFPSGHTTAIFSVITPYILLMPYLSIILIPLGLSVGVSRIYLGLHYPSDVLVGIILGSSVGVTCFLII